MAHVLDVRQTGDRIPPSEECMRSAVISLCASSGGKWIRTRAALTRHSLLLSKSWDQAQTLHKIPLHEVTAIVRCATHGSSMDSILVNRQGSFAHGAGDVCTAQDGNQDAALCFMISAGGKNILCSADTAEEAQMWVSKLAHAAAQMANFATVDSDSDPDADMPLVHHETCEGYVNKRGQLNVAFRRRYFVLSDGCLKYYKTKPLPLDVFANLECGSIHCEGLVVKWLDEHSRLSLLPTGAASASGFSAPVPFLRPSAQDANRLLQVITNADGYNLGRIFTLRFSRCVCMIVVEACAGAFSLSHVIYI
jgi:hypothetical protein